MRRFKIATFSLSTGASGMMRPTEAESSRLTTAARCVDRALLVDEDKILNPNYPGETRSVLGFGLARRGIFILSCRRVGEFGQWRDRARPTIPPTSFRFWL